ncbi:hypothetical protein Cgig2_008155 [Carnegiea gigantea]|uniref:Uncharacterized protein n=1 Tax=Carnegiea gigantea TaxID=171969 RepID=A0A9Q1QTS0_9CARY|nr:hypothetical protein Cgig2_008155 [Carnegiea gigantea]
MADKNFVNESAKGVNDPGQKYVQGQGTAYQQVMQEFEDFVKEQEPNVLQKTTYELALEEFVKTPVQQAMAPQPGGSSTHGTQVGTDEPEKLPAETHGKEKMAVETDEKEKVAVETNEKEELADDWSKRFITGQEIFSQMACDVGGLNKDEAVMKWRSMGKKIQIEYEKVAAVSNENFQKFAHVVSDERPVKIHETRKRELLDTNRMTQLWADCTAKQVFVEAHKGTKWSEDFLDALWSTIPDEEAAMYVDIARQRRECFQNFQQINQKIDGDIQKVIDAKFKKRTGTLFGTGTWMENALQLRMRKLLWKGFWLITHILKIKLDVDRHPHFRRSTCLFAVRTDGGWIDFCYQKCLRQYIRNEFLSQAERFIREHLNLHVPKVKLSMKWIVLRYK